jgi:D-sedoheptulose 7-phosphate isomerase
VTTEAGRAAGGARLVIAEALAALARLQDLAPEVDRAAEILETALSAGHTVYACGNGGSAADAQHFVGELVGRFAYDRPPLAAVALTADTSTITAVANDYGYDAVFARQVAALAGPGDVLVALSTSGSSPSVLQAAEVARAAGVTVIGMTGALGDRLRAFCECCLVVPATDTARIQEGHAVLIHALCALVEERLFPPGPAGTGVGA